MLLDPVRAWYEEGYAGCIEDLFQTELPIGGQTQNHVLKALDLIELTFNQSSISATATAAATAADRWNHLETKRRKLNNDLGLAAQGDDLLIIENQIRVH